MIVVDSNIIVYLWLPGEFTDNAKKLLFKDEDWMVPFLWRSEFRNVLAHYLRKNLLTLSAAYTIIENAERQFKANEYLINSEHVLELVNISNCSAYDCEYIALAKELNVELFTNDKLILSSFPETAIPLTSVK